ncbi:potassium transporter, partial [Mesorhizobium sp. M1C.F.Ca.ET.195.01.1.1]
TTLLHLEDGKLPGPARDKGPERASKQVKRGAARSARAVSKAEDTPVDKIHLTARAELEATTETIAAEARKGYGLLLVGLDNALTGKGTFSGTLNDITSGFDGPLCLVLHGAKSIGRMPMVLAA